VKLLIQVFPDRIHVAEMERYFTKGLKGSVATVNEGNGMPTVYNLSEVWRKCGVRGVNWTSWAGVNDEWKQEPHRVRGVSPLKEKSGTPVGRSHQGGGEGGGGSYNNYLLKFKRLAFYFNNQLFLKRTKLSEASSLTILSFTVWFLWIILPHLYLLLWVFGVVATVEFASL